jgi:hypothetical protein
LLVLGVIVFTLSCTDKPVPASPTSAAADLQPQMAAAKEKKGGDDSPLAIEDMLGDPIFRASVEGVIAPSVQEPLLEAVDALKTDRTKRAVRLIIEAQAEADALDDDSSGDAFESRLWWAVLERYFEEAELI